MFISLFCFNSSANATSIYDDIVHPVDRLLLVDADNPMTCREDLSQDWQDKVDELSPYSPAYMAARTSWVVSTEFNSSGQPISAYYYWWNNSVPAQASFAADKVSFQYHANGIRLWLNSSDCSLKATAVNILITTPPRFAQGDLYRPFLSHNISVTYPVAYEGEMIPGEVTPSALNYVGMGDSFSAGVGTYNSDLNAECYRSSDSYVPFVADLFSYELTAFVACAGDTTESLFTSSATAVAQFDALEDNTDRVTLTIGGNDVGFSEVLDACIHRPGESVKGYGCSSSGIVGIVNSRLAKLNNQPDVVATAPGGKEIHSITSVIDEIASLSPNASIYIAGYPNLFGEDVSDYASHGSAVYEAHCGSFLVNIEYPDALWMNDVGDELNEVIEDAVENAQNEGIDVTFVPAETFNGHALCDSDQQWINQFGLDAQTGRPLTESFHPTDIGWIQGYGYAFVSKME
jgi:lysophospholipase L1-like esterase